MDLQKRVRQRELKMKNNVEKVIKLKKVSNEVSQSGISSQSAKINPAEFRLGDGDISKYEENDFSNNSKSNVAKGINKSKKRQKEYEKIFEKDHKTKLNQDLEIKSEMSVRLDEKEQKKIRPKTAIAKEEPKAVIPKSIEVDTSKKRDITTITDEKK